MKEILAGTRSVRGVCYAFVTAAPKGDAITAKAIRNFITENYLIAPSIEDRWPSWVNNNLAYLRESGHLEHRGSKMIGIHVKTEAFDAETMPHPQRNSKLPRHMNLEIAAAEGSISMSDYFMYRSHDEVAVAYFLKDPDSREMPELQVQHYPQPLEMAKQFDDEAIASAQLAELEEAHAEERWGKPESGITGKYGSFEELKEAAVDAVTDMPAREPRVYVVNYSGHDYSTAAHFGKLEYITKGYVNVAARDRVLYEIISSIHDSVPTDYLCLSGHLLVNVLAAHVWHTMHGSLNLLTYEGRLKEYKEYQPDEDRISDIFRVVMEGS
jgi:hypothetical protein